ncbi:MAG: YbhB/YbcL family Raf kinase inhibitor-like protein [Synechococcales cyanobacterium T60_A2020_003]|nr:YbhB/YbcL family Raf kinase inhibitor-like protein [Synechococcales cyanobacterium T60_A2020_003]
MTITLTSPAFKDGQAIPSTFTCDGADLSPPLSWKSVPEDTQSLVLIVDDPDAPKGTWVHWVLFDVPGSTTELPEGIPSKATVLSGAKQGKNDFKRIGYGGPCPPPGKAHRYYFKLYALDKILNLEAGATKADLEALMKGHILAQGQLMGLYMRGK